jgi:hypothetical protein
MQSGNVIWNFKITIDNHDIGGSSNLRGYTLGLNVENHNAVRAIAEEAGFQVVCHQKPLCREYVGIEVAEAPDSPRLIRLLEILKNRYGYKPWPHAVFDTSQSDKYFGVQRLRSFSKKEIDDAKYLSYSPLGSVGHAAFREEDLFERDQYIVQNFKKLKKPVDIGLLQPFHGIAVTTGMKELLEKQNLIGLDLSKEVIGSQANLWGFGSSINLPRSLTRLVNGQGRDVDPDVWKVTTVHGGTEDHLFDDGCRPFVLRYKREKITELEPFDVARTYEFTGNHKHGAYRGSVVSQRFHHVLKELGVKRSYYVPVALE